MVILSYERKKRLDRTHIVLNTIAWEYRGYHHDSLMWVTIWTPSVTCRTNTKGVRCSSDLFTFCPNFVPHNQMFIRQNRPSVLSSSHMFKPLSDVRPIYMQCSDEHTGLLSCCASDKAHGGLMFVPFAQMCPGSTDHDKFPSKHTTSPQRREDVLLGRREDVLFAPTLGWKDVFWRRLEKTSSRRLVDVKAWRRIIVVFWLILCWKDVFATLYVRCL